MAGLHIKEKPRNSKNSMMFCFTSEEVYESMTRNLRESVVIDICLISAQVCIPFPLWPSSVTTVEPSPPGGKRRKLQLPDGTCDGTTHRTWQHPLEGGLHIHGFDNGWKQRPTQAPGFR